MIWFEQEYCLLTLPVSGNNVMLDWCTLMPKWLQFRRGTYNRYHFFYPMRNTLNTQQQQNCWIVSIIQLCGSMMAKMYVKCWASYLTMAVIRRREARLTVRRSSRRKCQKLRMPLGAIQQRKTLTLMRRLWSPFGPKLESFPGCHLSTWEKRSGWRCK